MLTYPMDQIGVNYESKAACFISLALGFDIYDPGLGKCATGQFTALCADNCACSGSNYLYIRTKDLF